MSQEVPVAAQKNDQRKIIAQLFDLAPGVVLSALVAAAGYASAPYVAHVLPIPNMVIALVVGMALNPIATRPITQAGMALCVRTVLRWAVALLGLRVAVTDIAALGLRTAVLIIVAMSGTVLASFAIAKLSGRTAGFGALVAAGTSVCGASATLACSTVVPEYKGKQADIAFVVVAVNAFATLAMLFYPPICIAIGFDAQSTGVMLGGTIHDVAQVVGAGYSISDTVGNTAVIVKLFRVFLLLPVVLGIGWYFTRSGARHGEAHVPVPMFALVFLILCAINSAVALLPSMLPIYVPAKKVLVEVSNWGLLLAIGALGLGTSIKTMMSLGFRHVGAVLGATAVIFVIVTGGLAIIVH